MLSNSFEFPQFTALDAEDMRIISGGTAGPSKSTGFWYDVAYYATKGVLAIIDLANHPEQAD